MSIVLFMQRFSTIWPVLLIGDPDPELVPVGSGEFRLVHRACKCRPSRLELQQHFPA